MQPIYHFIEAMPADLFWPAFMLVTFMVWEWRVQRDDGRWTISDSLLTDAEIKELYPYHKQFIKLREFDVECE